MTGDRDAHSREELADIALAAAKEAVRQTLNETFAHLGVNLMNFEDVKEFRQDMEMVRTLRPYRDDLEFARALRLGSKRVGSKFVITLVTVLASAIAIGAWEFIKGILHIH